MAVVNRRDAISSQARRSRRGLRLFFSPRGEFDTPSFIPIDRQRLFFYPFNINLLASRCGKGDDQIQIGNGKDLPIKHKLLLLAPVLACIFWLSFSLVDRHAPPARAAAPPGTPYVFLPFSIRTDSTPTPTFAPNAQEVAIANYMRQDPNQQRPALNWNATLAQVARARALDMGTRAYFSHVNPDGFGPNYLVQKAGYALPSWYDQSPTGNNIESIGAGAPTATDVWNLWMSSLPHRTHLLGLDSFFAAQTDYGIGYAYVPGSPYGYYWVVITARH